ncbi:MAG: hypothetical protein HVK28_00525 [Pelagibacteraceae bacterium]|nr:hypothetical protein [Pelagibacteraceae bacterium]
MYEDKIIELIKSKITLTKKSINLKEAEEILKILLILKKVSKLIILKKSSKIKNDKEKIKKLAKTYFKLYKR